MRFLVALFTLLALLATSEAHNWVSSMSRVPRAATTFPCMAKRSELPHVQLGLFQTFLVEWAMGHNDFVFFTLLKAEDSDLMRRHNTNLLNDYIADGQAASLIGDNIYKAYRRNRNMDGCHRVDDVTVPANTLYDNLLVDTDSLYIDRPLEFCGDELNRITANNCQGYLWKYKDSDRQGDDVVIYNNPDYPWIMGVWKYEIEPDCASEVDTARFWVPGATPGQYILHYKWRGYYDCIDIDVLDQMEDTVFPYGDFGDPENPSYNARRVDHCYFPPNEIIQRGRDGDGIQSVPYEVYGAKGHETCVSSCISRYDDGCEGVNVLPIGLGDRDFGPHWTPGDNFISKFLNDSFWCDVRWTSTDQDADARRAELQAYYQARTDDPLVCVLVAPNRPTSTTDKYLISDDPLDPVWYSTCYEIVKIVKFVGYDTGNGTSENTAPRGDWKHMGRCISCEAREMATQDRVPRWELATSCKNCDREPPTNVPPPFNMELVGHGYCDYNSNAQPSCSTPSDCRKDIKRIGWDVFDGTDGTPFSGAVTYDNSRTVPNAEACGAIAALDPDCGSYFDFGFYSSGSIGYCYCNYAPGRGPCQTCVDTCFTRASDLRWSYTTEPTFNTVADSPCTNGVANTAGDACCSAGCSDCDGSARNGMVCNADRIPAHRNCDNVGAPCHMNGSARLDLDNPVFPQYPTRP